MIDLKSRIKNHKSTIGVIGLGYVGLPLSIRFSEEGFKVVGLDIDKEKVKLLNVGKSYIKHIKEADISKMANNGFNATTDFSEISNVDVIIICVPTPLGVHNEPDLSCIHGTLENIKPFLKENQLLILESTTYPGTTEEILVPFINSIQNQESKIKNQKFTLGVNFYLGYSPEREDPGNKNFSTQTIPKVVSGHTKNCLEITKSLYTAIVNDIVPVSSTRVAEMTKILENVHRAVNIALVNELKMVADKMNINIFEAINAAATKPFGFTPYFPGPGLGGHCIPIDPYYLSWKAKQYGIKSRLIELASEINREMPGWVVTKLIEILAENKKDISHTKILILGLAYKKNVNDTRESPSFELIERLTNLGAKVEYSDPYIPVSSGSIKYSFSLESVKLSSKSIGSYDAIILVTDHDDYNYDLLQKNAKIIIDTRNKFESSNNIIKA